MRTFALCFLLALPAAGLEPYLVKDINTEHIPGASFPGGFALFGGAAVFSADDGRSGLELWRSDGTEAGTWQVADVCPGECSERPRPLAVAGRLLFFSASAGLGLPRTLWVTDGTQGSAVSLTPNGSELGEDALWVPSQGVLYFSLSEGRSGSELWRSDGTPEGTFQIADLAAGRGSRPRGFAWFQGLVWFAADGDGGSALWRTDGTRAGTRKFKDVHVHPFVIDAPRFLNPAGKRLVFVVPGPNGREELWATDGTGRGTVRLLRLERSHRGHVFLDFRRLGRRLVFIADDGRRGHEPWVTDGTARGTRLLRDVCPGSCSGAVRLWQAHQGRLYWVGNDGARGEELWLTDGTAAGTRIVRDIRAGEFSSSPDGSAVLGNRLFFSAESEGPGREVWSTDGTASGTARVTDFEAGLPLLSPFEAVAVGGRLLFAANGGPEAIELWGTDGTLTGTALVRDINDLELSSSLPRMIGALGSAAFFFTGDGFSDFQLWKSDGTPAGTVPVLGLGVPQQPLEISEQAGGKLFFPVSTQEGALLWRTDGTAAGTFPVTRARVVLCCAPIQLRAVGDRVYFVAHDDQHGAELWVSDGTAEGTRLVQDVWTGPATSEPRDLVELGGVLYFTAAGDDRVRRVRSTGGTLEGEDVSLLAVHGGRLWYFADHGRVLLSSDGTPAGTVEVQEFGPGFIPQLMASLGERLVFSVLGLGVQEGLWALEGIEGGAMRVGGAAQPGTAWTVFDGRIFYTPVAHFEPLSELAVSDGTEAGTLVLPVPGRHGLLEVFSFAPLGERLLFSTESGRLLWETDGLTVSPVPGLEPSHGGLLLSAGPRVFLSAIGPDTGTELWAIQ